MKTTVEISNPLFERARAMAAKEEISLRELFETGLRLALDHQPARGAFVLRDARFRGRGLRRDYRDGSWDDLRDAAYPRSSG